MRAPDDHASALEREHIAQARAGDTAAFGMLVSMHQSALRAQLRRLLRGDDALADDLAQEAFVQAWRALPGFRGDAQLATWLYRIAYRCYLMHRRAHPAAPVPQSAMADEPAHCPQPALGIDLQRALDRLPEAERVALLHCCVLDLSHDEAAAVLALPLGTLKSQVARAKARLRESLAAWQAEARA